MRKQMIGCLFLVSAVFTAFAGDAAVFVDGGFSSDGTVYVFGQYGKTDKSFQGWAEIYIVDIQKNDYAENGVFRIKPSAVTADKTGKEVYETLAGKSFYATKKYDCAPAKPDQILYIREDDGKAGTDEILFKDFSGSLGDNGSRYSVQIVPEVTGRGVGVSSSFFIALEKKDADGRVLARQKIGSPQIKRKGVKDYRIERIVCDRTGRNLVFVIEKITEDKTGTNVRYMIEAAVLSGDFS